jgi:hypothetical protein
MKMFWSNIKWFFNQLSRSLAYFKHSWGGYDWDYSYSIDMFQYSLKRLADSLDSNGAYGVNAKHKASRCRMIIKLMGLVNEEYYALKYQDVMEQIYGSCTMVTEELENGSYRLVGWRWEKAVNDAHNEKINELSREMQKKSEQKQRRAEVLLWKLVEHNIRSFWD